MHRVRFWPYRRSTDHRARSTHKSDRMTVPDVIVRQPQRYHHSGWTLFWGVLLGVWMIALCLLPDPRPLGAPDTLVALVKRLVGVSEPSARAAATIAFRTCGLAVLGLLLALSMSQLKMKWAAVFVLIAGPFLAILCLWINYGYYPLFFQVQMGIASVLLGGLAGLALRRTLIGKVAFVLASGSLFLWGISTGISDDVDKAARITGQYVLASAEVVPEGDPGFAAIVDEAFRFAEDNSHRTSAVETNKAVIVALGVILGERRIAKVAGRELREDYSKEISTIRRRITLRGRSDLPQHFWVSAALTVLSDENRSITVGIGKELMDATPGGSGFSFVDLMADQAGNSFARAATKDEESARLIQKLIRGGAEASDFLPAIDGLPEGIPMEEFQVVYGGLRGERTSTTVAEIQTRLKACKMLSSND